jgi:hypothetical protein
LSREKEKFLKEKVISGKKTLEKSRVQGESNKEYFWPATCRMSRAYWVGSRCKQPRVPPDTNSRSFG